MACLPDMCTDGQDIWMAWVPLICFDIVEWYFLDHILRQFGLHQSIPQMCDTGLALHGIDR